jgi:hypothetical protein
MRKKVSSEGNVSTASTGGADLSNACSSVMRRTERTAECLCQWKAPSNFFHSSFRNIRIPELLKVQIIRDTMLCQTGDVSKDRYFPHLQDEAVQEEPQLDSERERINDRSKRREVVALRLETSFMVFMNIYRIYTWDMTTNGFICSCECWYFCGTRPWIIQFGWTSERQISCKTALPFSISSMHTDGRTQLCQQKHMSWHILRNKCGKALTLKIL